MDLDFSALSAFLPPPPASPLSYLSCHVSLNPTLSIPSTLSFTKSGPPVLFTPQPHSITVLPIDVASPNPPPDTHAIQLTSTTITAFSATHTPSTCIVGQIGATTSAATSSAITPSLAYLSTYDSKVLRNYPSIMGVVVDVALNPKDDGFLSLEVKDGLGSVKMWDVGMAGCECCRARGKRRARASDKSVKEHAFEGACVRRRGRPARPVLQDLRTITSLVRSRLPVLCAHPLSRRRHVLRDSNAVLRRPHN